MNDEYGNTVDDTNDDDSDSDDGDNGDIDNNDDERNWDDNNDGERNWDESNNDFDVKYTYHLFLNDEIAASVPKCTRFPVIICE